MVDQDILTSLRNALERGENLDDAVKTLITAGYDRFEVNEAAKAVMKEMTESQLPEVPMPKTAQQQAVQQVPTAQQMPYALQEQPATIQPATLMQPSPQPSQPSLPPIPSILPQKKKKSKKLILILAIVFLLILAGAISYILITKFT